ncbi:hypothetical protein [Microbacterium sp. SLBN-146]|uniref:hypothetical protein n=1 Tax=Microbacterium sp. SLBN-146 TaxID=2768457 RepID=UPI001151FBDE|nr:hypothetical protein [Microbacterium sp. SLBN-146]TQJ31942.1 hypothetical protein FBY39_2431 [Microbacterium sp. SLBN-146]
MELLDILGLIPNYIGALAGVGALVVSIFAYNRSKTAKSETAEVAKILSQALLELAKPREVTKTVESLRDHIQVSDEVAAQIARAEAMDRSTFNRLRDELKRELKHPSSTRQLLG